MLPGAYFAAMLPDNMLPVAYFAASGEDDGVLHQLSHDGVLELLNDVNIEYAMILRQIKNKRRVTGMSITRLIPLQPPSNYGKQSKKKREKKDFIVKIRE